MSNIIIQVVKWALIVALVITVMLSLTGIVFFIYSGIGVALNASAVSDILYTIQMWLPFNLGPVIAWIFTIVNMYLIYRIAVLVFDLGRKFIGIN